MKFLFLGLTLCFGLSLSAQKLLTREGYVKFFSDAPLEDIEAETRQMSSIINTADGSFAFLIPIKSFNFEKALMQEHFNENYLESGQYPNATFKGKISNLSDIDFAQDGRYEAIMKGTMEIHGVSREIEEKVTLIVQDGVVSLETIFTVKAADYAIKIPAGKADNISEVMEVTVKAEYASR